MRRPPFYRVFGAFSLRELREAASYKAASVLQVMALLFALSALYYLSAFIGATHPASMAPYGSNYLGFVLLGFILTEFQATSIGAFAQRIRWSQLAGTLEAMLATPARPWQILVAAPAGDFGAAIVRGGAYLLLAVFAFGVHLHGGAVATALLGFALAAGAWIGLGFFAAAVSMLLRKNEPIRWLVSGMSLLVGGVLYPTSILPSWLRTIGQALPITHALEICRRSLLAGAPLSAMRGRLIALGAFCAVFLPLGLVAFGLALRRARVDGSLTHY